MDNLTAVLTVLPVTARPVETVRDDLRLHLLLVRGNVAEVRVVAAAGLPGRGQRRRRQGHLRRERGQRAAESEGRRRARRRPARVPLPAPRHQQLGVHFFQISLDGMKVENGGLP